MDSVYLSIGKIVCGIGGGIFCLGLVGGFVCIVCDLWIIASNKFRDICKAESLIFEYRKNRNDFMYWKHMEDNGERKKT